MTRRIKRRRVRFEGEDPGARRGSGVKQLIVLLAVAFVVALGTLVGTRMSADAIAVLVGVIAGVAASIPCALLLMAVTRRQPPEERGPYAAASRRYDDRWHDGYGPHPATPPVIVVTPGGGVPQPLSPWTAAPGPADAAYPYAYGGAQPQSRREFRVMGYEEPESQGDGQA
jgi:hypothetical protein